MKFFNVVSTVAGTNLVALSFWVGAQAAHQQKADHAVTWTLSQTLITVNCMIIGAALVLFGLRDFLKNARF